MVATNLYMDSAGVGSKVAAIVVAGGSGSRFGAPLPKQFHELNGYPVYIWPISQILSMHTVMHIVITAPPEHIARVQSDLLIFSEAQRQRVSVIAGGATRQESVYNALHHLVEHSPDLVIIHDGARPFAGVKSFNDCLSTLKKSGACTIGMPVSDTIKKIDHDVIVETVDRSQLWSVQTPQGAPFKLLLQCHEGARANGISVTDDAAILESFGHKVTIFAGFSHNIKVTVADDFKTCQLLSPLYLSNKPMQP
ncbi:MAG: 2-C-methyl-D-erythritol 4-phosphate cytidylyltransferase [Candidatus Obscuribacter sp.]|nr:2-C-methyl-D-erythritol 4-phosphate cytidylyltransferase [Candidatus Obscuribacter sp.]MBP6350556.1 2-C-methyl-D-erythritol 4-phosphate cytidylyltransferase [Candidatus Obscuribacter sp.]MBP6594846.1 2-C-methyl-D-erythritol 4-phosphate cytidylyltransferase [Candidatus Obscuribacter sp.]MBP7576425.1 2-C-methyl-D-erythritol 4-phosphate cytidylyltransferase [Candidatus Obscuribacter sp.]